MNKTRGRSLLFTLAFLLSPYMWAQDLPMLHYSKEDGLPSNTIYGVYRDSNGFMWIGTDKGIARYNGLKFETLTTFDGVPDNEIFFFQEDYQRRLWIATYNGELCYYQNGIFHTAANTPLLRLPFKTSFTRNIMLEADSSITIVFFDKSRFLNIKDNRCKVYELKKTFNKDELEKIVYLKKTERNQYALYMIDSIAYIDSNCNRIKLSSGVNYESFRYVFSQGQKYLIKDRQVFDDNFKPIKNGNSTLPENTHIYTAYRDSGNLFVATNNGLYINGKLHLLEGNKISYVSQDLPGNYWLTTLNNGFFILANNLEERTFTNAYNGEAEYSYADEKNVFFTNNHNNVYQIKGDRAKCVFDLRAPLKTKRT